MAWRPRMSCALGWRMSCDLDDGDGCRVPSEHVAGALPKKGQRALDLPWHGLAFGPFVAARPACVGVTGRRPLNPK